MFKDIILDLMIIIGTIIGIIIGIINDNIYLIILEGLLCLITIVNIIFNCKANNKMLKDMLLISFNKNRDKK